VKKTSSYIGELSSGYESDTVKEYDPAKTEGQIGKEVNDEVEKTNIWEGDKHLPNGLGQKSSSISFKEASIKLRRIARKLATMEMDYKDNNKKPVEEKTSDINMVSYQEGMKRDLGRLANKIQGIGTDLESLVRKAQSEHPSESKPETWIEESPAQLGDDEWIDIGPGTFADPRNEVGKPLPQ